MFPPILFTVPEPRRRDAINKTRAYRHLAESECWARRSLSRITRDRRPLSKNRNGGKERGGLSACSVPVDHSSPDDSQSSLPSEGSDPRTGIMVLGLSVECGNAIVCRAVQFFRDIWNDQGTSVDRQGYPVHLGEMRKTQGATHWRKYWRVRHFRQPQREESCVRRIRGCGDRGDRRAKYEMLRDFIGTSAPTSLRWLVQPSVMCPLKGSWRTRGLEFRAPLALQSRRALRVEQGHLRKGRRADGGESPAQE